MRLNRSNIFIGIFGSGLTLILTLLTLFLQWQQSNVSLSYEVVDASPLIKSEEVSQDWELRYQNRKVSNPHLVIYKITNSGSKAITKSDYDQPILINLGESASILESSVVLMSSSNRETTVEDNAYSNNLIVRTDDKHTVEIEPTLLNSKDSLLVKIIAENINIDTLGIPSIRVSGVQDVVPLSSIKPSYYIPFGLSREILLLGSFGVSAGVSALAIGIINRIFNLACSWGKSLLITVSLFLVIWSLLGLLALMTS